MTKEQQTELRGYHERVVKSALDLQRSQLAHEEAKRRLEMFLHTPPKRVRVRKPKAVKVEAPAA